MKAIIAATLLAVSVGAHAEFESGNTLLRDLNSQSSFVEGTARGFIIGVHDSFSGFGICTPVGIQAGQLYDIVRKHLQNNPEIRHFSAASIIFDKLSEVYPCKKGAAR